ncbi:TonB-dependent heme/hemoglobin receptor family protein [[Leptolyngbya] sp. PCC 7376]|uniref:TonB-dependent hemoglobin/transferrin/lactoferrin family receptor n=1 Tax=[Leptolyngbya] sp. PCC 7376 TaxID=111781 RepID=UPI00029F0084|nr:TonB-dependent hemoglobin/transferrin/lactoferrin family receptor [[Leptolyngbya] sp. PCC 7376]AFY38232.1 TonB-dependent heme/hemoglobin receptor family protein [[Leptolyngbya] sp. PCC 7376]
MKPFSTQLTLSLISCLPILTCGAMGVIASPTPLIAQAEDIQTVTAISFEPWEGGYEVIFETSDGEPLNIDAGLFRRDGNDFVTIIENATLALDEADSFASANPTEDISEVSVIQLTDTSLEVRVMGIDTPPTTEVSLRSSYLAYVLNPGDVAIADQEITILGTRNPRPVALTPNFVTVIDSDDLDRTLSQDLRDAFRYEPNVSVGNNRRFGLQDVRIRGLGGNRVLLLNDGIRLPSLFSFGTPSLGRDYVDIESLQQIEIGRGPASSLFGSDALAGIVNFRTLEPSDLLDKKPGQDWVSRISSTYETVDKSWQTSGVTAFAYDNLEFLLGYTRRDGYEARVPNDNEFVDDLYTSRDNFLGKVNVNLNEESSLSLTTEIFESNFSYQVAPIIAENLLGPRGFIGQDERTDTDFFRNRYSLAYRYNSETEDGFLDAARFQFYYQDAGTDEFRLQNFLNPTGTERRIRNLNNTFDDDIIGIDLQLQSIFNIGKARNTLTYGVDFSNTSNERIRDGLETRFDAAGNLTLSSNQVGSDSFPVKDFPDSNTSRIGVFVQNELELSDKFTLLPGFRFDSYELTTQSDELFENNSPEAQSADFSDSSFSPNLGFVWQTSPKLAVVGRYARGFRGPLYSEINAGFTNLSSPFFRYKTLSNPNLRPETSDTFELGIRSEMDRGSLSLTGFYTKYNNFIETFASAGVEIDAQTGAPIFPFPGSPTVAPILLFQSQNIGDARTYGLEVAGEYRFSDADHGFSVIGSLGWTVGDDLDSDQPLESVDPIKAVLGLRYSGKDDRWGTELVTTFVGEPRLADNRPDDAFTPDAYTVVDLLGYYNINEDVKLNFGVFNLFDTEYFQYSDVQTLVNGSEPEDISRFAQPGISLRAGLSWQF